MCRWLVDQIGKRLVAESGWWFVRNCLDKVKVTNVLGCSNAAVNFLEMHQTLDVPRAAKSARNIFGRDNDLISGRSHLNLISC